MLQNPELKIDLEFENLLLTDSDCTPLFRPFFYKQIETTRTGVRIPCPSCNQTPSGNVEGSIDCPYCEGIGYKWKEGIGDGWFYKQTYMTDRSIVSSVPLATASATFNKIFLAFSKDLRLNEGDVILKPELRADTNMVIPIINSGMFKVYESLNQASNQTQSEFNIVSLTSTYGRYFRILLNE